MFPKIHCQHICLCFDKSNPAQIARFRVRAHISHAIGKHREREDGKNATCPHIYRSNIGPIGGAMAQYYYRTLAARHPEIHTHTRVFWECVIFATACVHARTCAHERAGASPKRLIRFAVRTAMINECVLG